MGPEIPPGTVTIADLYRELVGMRAEVVRALERLAVMESRNQAADAISADHETRIRALDARVPDNAEDRLTALERSKYKLVGAAVAVSAIISALGTWIGLTATHP